MPLVAPVMTITCSSILLSFIFLSFITCKVVSAFIFKRVDAGFGDLDVLRHRSAGYPDRSDDVAVAHERDAAAENDDLQVVARMNSIDHLAGLRERTQGLGRHVEGPGREC